MLSVLDKNLPAFHRGESVRVLHCMEFSNFGSVCPPVVGIGSSPGTRSDSICVTESLTESLFVSLERGNFGRHFDWSCCQYQRHVLTVLHVLFI